ncbi:MAG: hypothetical protein LBI05_06195 [Planctomycetaceae bacterium]|nr:hypothetical protein [Planctomycetaceae bacterium]
MSAPVTYETILETIQRIALKQEETAEQMKETDRQMKRTDKKISELGNRIGQIVENMVGGNIVSQFQNYGYNVTVISRNIEFGINGTAPDGEIDVQLDDGDVAILIEVKTKLTVDDVRHHLETMEKYRKCKGDNQKRYIGAVASTVVDDNVVKFAQKNGMYVIVQSGYAVEILVPPEGFKAKEW